MNKTVINVYAVFIISLILSVIPNMWVSLMSFILFMGVFIAAYLIRDEESDQPFVNGHMTHIIRTIWVASLVLSITLIAGIFYMLAFIDHAPMMPCLDAVANASPMRMSDPDYMMGLVKPCWPDYWAVNGSVFIISLIITVAPLFLYLIWRCGKGLKLAMTGHNILNPKAWI